MKIQLHPMAALPGQPDDAISVSGDVLTHNGRTFDLSPIEEGGEANPTGPHPFVGPITRQGGVIHVGVRYAYDTATAEPNQPANPAYWVLEITEGDVADLVVRRSEPEAIDPEVQQ
ncbi:hypothetical protein ATO8_00035 [Roseivivax marinus]|uniref:Uncharacterized protein n=1 Tax=Roseivivax marinus TaxID=1379903 RepID=W4HQG6_9RHOB|nr:hypothetical protein [Roseivivax marinus]ETW14250.1 hypothetical protein ATO8_00035 [Roseivivax marinus]